MEKKSCAIVYPYDLQFAPLLRHKEFIGDFEITGVVSPFSWGLCGKDAGYADRGPDIGIMVESDFDLAMQKCDTVIFTESEFPCDFDRTMLPKIRSAADKGKNIAVTLGLDRYKYDEVNEICERKGVAFAYYHSIAWDIINLSPPELERHYIHKINVPVIFVLGDGEKTRKFEVQLSIREQFINEGYAVSQIGSRSNCEILGFHSIPTFLFETRNESEKIYLFNKYVKNIELQEKPDVIIIGIPGGIMPQSSMNNTYFGMTAYEMSNAIAPDASVFCTYYASWKPVYFEKMCEVVKYRLGLEVDCFMLSNSRIDWRSSEDSVNDPKFYYIKNEKVERMKRELAEINPPVFNILGREDAKNMANLLIDKLAEYASVDHF
ncbi:MAG: peptide maturation system protein family [Herbinix sp.]|jgi:peptide maturation system protein (TIGR04066 family)|nr:peptide maturation system protein family [Herbinix sp.]